MQEGITTSFFYTGDNTNVLLLIVWSMLVCEDWLFLEEVNYILSRPSDKSVMIAVFSAYRPPSEEGDMAYALGVGLILRRYASAVGRAL